MGQLHVRVRLFSCSRLIVEDMQPAISDLQEIDVPGHDLRIKVQIESVVAVIRQVRSREIDRYLDCDGYGVVDEHEALQRFMPFVVVQGRGQDECRCTSGMILLVRYVWPKLGRNLDERYSAPVKSWWGKLVSM